MILPATVTRTSGRATGYLPPCSEDGQSFLGWLQLHPVYANRYKMGRGRGIVTMLSQVQKQGMVCAVFI